MMQIPSFGYSQSPFNTTKSGRETDIRDAVIQGCRLFVCSSFEAAQQVIVGQSLKKCIEDGLVKREELVIANKFSASTQDSESSCQQVLDAMGLDYFDIVMVAPYTDGGDEDLDSACKVYEDMFGLVSLGLAKHIGVSNFSTSQLSELIDKCAAATHPVVNEVERHLFLQQPRLFDYCKQRDIHVLGFAPFGNDKDVYESVEMQEISNETDKSPEQVMLAWAIQSGSTVLLSENTDKLQSFWELEDKAFLNREQMNRLYAVDRGNRFVIVDNYDFPDDNIDLSLTQPKATKGLVDEDDVYRNRFERAGKPLESNIIIESGALRKLKSRGLEFVPERCHEAKNYLIVDSIVNEEYGDKVLQGLRDAGLDMHKIVTPADAVDESGNPSAERHKTLAVFSNCVNKILDSGISKNSCIVSLGGGVVNNLCGFLASSLYRGITLVHITTSMMGMTDAAIDFKQAVNHQLGKNLLGSYYPAANIVIDPEVLETLSERHILNGIAEALKHALCQSRSMTEAIVNPLSEDLRKALRNSEFLEMVCRECIDHKVPTLTHYHESDFNEMVPQYGHAIAHAVEHLSFHSKGVSPLLHGEAVAIGMCVTAEVGKILGVCDQATVDEHYDFIQRAGLPVYIPDGIGTEAIQKKLCYDKHYVKKPTMGLLAEIGHMHCNRDGSYSVEIDNDVIEKAISIHMERRDNADETTDLYTVEASQTLKSSGLSGTSLTQYTDSQSESGDSDDEGSSTANSIRQVEWDPMTANKFGVVGRDGCYCNPWDCRC